MAPAELLLGIRNGLATQPPSTRVRQWDSGGGPMRSKVTLHLYDVVGHALLRNVNHIFRALGTGAFHTGVEVYGQEWSYGFSDHRRSGIFCCTPRSCNVHTYREAIEMGETNLSPGHVKSLLEDLAKTWLGQEYDLLRRNCCHFTDELCRRLGVGPLPNWITNLASAGAALLDSGVDFRVSLGILRTLDDPVDTLCGTGELLCPALPPPILHSGALMTPSPERKEPEEEPRAQPWRVDRDMEIRKWEEMLAVGIPLFMRHHPVTFHRRVHRGVPPTLRWQIWKDACGYDGHGPVEQYDELCKDSPWSPLIALDIGRTFSELPEFSETRQESLRRVLNAYANHSPSVGYCQGMNFVAGLLLIVSGSEREAFGLFVRLMDHDGLAGFYKESMPVLRTYVKACDRLVAEQLPELREHFRKESVPLALYLHQWFLTLFIKSFPLETVLVLWDVIITEGLPVILTIAVTILRVLNEGLLTMQFEEINAIFKAMKVQKSSEFLSCRIGQLLMRRSISVGLPEHIQEYLRSKPESEVREGPLEDDEDEEHWSTLVLRHTPRRRRGSRRHRLAASATKQVPSEKCDWAERGCTLAERELASVVFDGLEVETLEPDPVPLNLASALAAAGVDMDNSSARGARDDAPFCGKEECSHTGRWLKALPNFPRVLARS